MKRFPLISVILVALNEENSIEATIKSILNQSYPKVELVVIDGGSTDKTIDVIKKYERMLSVYISEKDDGTYHAMNKGIKLAKGEWVNFMNAGDNFIDPLVLENVFKKKTFSDIGVIYGDTIVKMGSHRLYAKPRRFQKINRQMIFCHQSSFVRLKYLKENEFDLKYQYASDYAFFYKLHMSGVNFKYLPILIAEFDGQGISSNNVPVSVMEYAKINGRYFNLLWRLQYAVYSKMYFFWRVLKKTLSERAVYFLKKSFYGFR